MEARNMNLLVTGNGLDLDLKLPTRYSDFLDFTKAFSFFDDVMDKIDEFNINEYNLIDKKFKALYHPNLLDIHQKTQSILKIFDKSFSDKFINKACKDFFYCVHNNCWIEYFNGRYEQNLIAGENWIDLEGEIQNVIHAIEEKRNFQIIASPNKYEKFLDSNEFPLNLQQFIYKNQKDKITIFEDNYKKFKLDILKDFDKFVMALGIYLDFFVSQLSPNIKKASKEIIDMMSGKNQIDHVLSFNYINNFKNNKLGNENVCFVHGAVDYKKELENHISDTMSKEDKDYMSIQNIINRNKMIVGFDELQDSDENFTPQDFELEFVDYRKYFQRIYKGTESHYVDWLNEYKVRLQNSVRTSTNPENWSNLYKQKLEAELSCSTPNHAFIFGHSLDATDNEILKDIFLREHKDTKVTIYYHDSDSRKRIISNLIRILTKPVLVQKTKGKNPEIEFIQQTYSK